MSVINLKNKHSRKDLATIIYPSTDSLTWRAIWKKYTSYRINKETVM